MDHLLLLVLQLLFLFLVVHLLLVFTVNLFNFDFTRLLQVLLRMVIREISSRSVQSVVVVSRDQKFSLLVSQMLIWVHASLSQDSDVPLQLFDLVQVVNEGLGNLLHQEGAVGNIKLDLSFDVIVRVLKSFHFHSGTLLSLVTLLSQARSV